MDDTFQYLNRVKEIASIRIGVSPVVLHRLRQRWRHWQRMKGVYEVRFPSGEIRRAEVHWYETDKVKPVGHKVKDVELCQSSLARPVGFAVCLKGDEFDGLTYWKAYLILEDDPARQLGCLRVVDDSGEDYLHPANRFVELELPESIFQKLLSAVDRKYSGGYDLCD